MVKKFIVQFKVADASWREDKWMLIFPSCDANSYETKKEAVREARRLAKLRKPAEVVIERKDGTVSRINNYGFR